jgi:branched-chain amino acid transport system permease protein
MAEFTQYVVSGLAVGSIYGLVALGFVLIFKSTDIFNFAQGDLVMVGAYLGFGAMDRLGMPFWAAAITALLVAALLGLGLQQVVFRPMLGNSLLTMVMITIALSLIIRGVVVIIFGPLDKTYPDQLPGGAMTVAGVTLSYVDLIIMGVAAVAIACFTVFFQFSKTGLQMRAIGENSEAAAVCGVNANRMFSVAIMVGTVTAAAGGLLLANLQIVSPQLSDIGLIAFPAAVLGGMHSIPGAVVGGLTIGVIGQLSAGYVDGTAANVTIYLVLLLVLLIRPTGIFGAREVVRV